MSEQTLAMNRELDAAAVADHQRLLYRVFQLPDLLAERRLRLADLPGGAAHHSGVGDRHEIPQHIDVELYAHAVMLSCSSRWTSIARWGKTPVSPHRHELPPPF